MSRGPHRGLPALSRSAFGATVLMLALLAVALPPAGAQNLVPPAPRSDTAAAGPFPPAAGPALGPWANLTGPLATGPGARYDAASAWDPADSEIVAFGGIPPGGGALRTTWVFQGGAWEAATPHTLNSTDSPTARFGAAMAFDAADGYIVLFGGRGAVGGLLADTWKFVGGNWTNITATAGTPPPPRVNASAAYDPSLTAVVLFGGRSPTAVYNDTWEFSAGQWHDASASVPTALNTPARRYAGALAFSASANALVLFGGYGFQAGTYVPLGDTWTFGPSGWSSLTPPRAPSPRAAAVFDALPNGTLLLYGGALSHGLGQDTWYYTGTAWTNVSGFLRTPPSGRSAALDAPVVLGGSQGYILVFGGLTANGGAGDTWAVGANTVVATRGTATPGTIDVNQTTVLTITAFGPTASLGFNWTSRPAGCTPTATATGASLTCVPPSPGNFTAIVAISSSGASGTVSASIPFVVNSPPAIRSVTVAPYPFVLGQGTLTVTVVASGGTGTLHYAYSGLPIGCSTNDTAFLRCSPLGTGSWTVRVTVHDGTNASTAANASVVVSATGPPPPSKLLARLTSPLAIAGAVIGVGLLLLIAYYVQRRRRRRREESDLPEGASAEYPAPPPVR